MLFQLQKTTSSGNVKCFNEFPFGFQNIVRPLKQLDSYLQREPAVNVKFLMLQLN